MALLLRMVLLILVIALIGGAVALGFWTTQPPTTKVERVIPNDRFFQK